MKESDPESAHVAEHVQVLHVLSAEPARRKPHDERNVGVVHVPVHLGRVVDRLALIPTDGRGDGAGARGIAPATATRPRWRLCARN